MLEEDAKSIFTHWLETHGASVLQVGKFFFFGCFFFMYFIFSFFDGRGCLDVGSVWFGKRIDC